MIITALIMAGGQGIRFWPLSRKEKPKQFLPLIGSESLLQQTIRRIKGLVPPARIFIVTHQDYLGLVKKQAEEVPVVNIIIEPLKKNTAPAIGLASLQIENKYPGSVMVVLPSDHLIRNKAVFTKHIKKGIRAAAGGKLITLGIPPTYPETGYGYICCSKKPRRGLMRGLYRVVQFTEKPDLDRARNFLAAGNYLWNSGIFIWQVRCILKAIETHLPELHLSLVKIKNALGTAGESGVTVREYRKIKSISIDNGILEKSDNIAVIPGNFGWDDLGTWPALQRIFPADPRGNTILGKHLGIDTRGTIIYSPDKLVMSIGTRDMLIVNTEDSIFVCDINRLREIEKLIKILEIKGLRQYL